MHNSVITAYQIVRKYSISYQTLNYYTNMGLLTVVKKEKNTRWYKEKEVQKNLADITHLKDEGYPLRLISRLLQAPHHALSFSGNGRHKKGAPL